MNGGPIGLFARHPTAANLLMILMIGAGALSIARNNTQFFPDFDIETVIVSVAWPGAGASDVEAGVVEALEPEIRLVDDVKTVRAAAREGAATIVVEFDPGADIQAGSAAVENAVAQATALPEGSEKPVVSRIAFADTVSRVAVSGPFPEAALKARAKRMAEDLLARGVDRVDLFGARGEEIHVDVRPETLLRLDMTLGDVARAIAATSRDLPAGDTAGASERQLRGLGLRADATGLAEIGIRGGPGGERLLLGDMARVSDGFKQGSPRHGWAASARWSCTCSARRAPIRSDSRVSWTSISLPWRRPCRRA